MHIFSLNTQSCVPKSRIYHFDVPSYISLYHTNIVSSFSYDIYNSICIHIPSFLKKTSVITDMITSRVRCKITSDQEKN